MGELGAPLMHALLGYAHERYDEAAETLQRLRPAAFKLGGSHAQRDVIDLTLIAAAARAGDRRLARALAGERTARKPSAARSVERLLAHHSGLVPGRVRASTSE
jgi:hypothetical protein